MNGLKNLVYSLLNAAGLTYLWVDDTVQDTVVALRHTLIRYMIFTGGLVILAAIIGRGGYWSRSVDANGVLSAMTGAEHLAVWLFALNYFIGAVLIAVMIFRALPFLFGIPAATGIARAIAENSPFKIDLGFDTAKDSYQLVSRGLWATAVSLQLLGLFMTLVPIYRSFTAFLLVLGSVALIAFAVIGRGVGGEWFDRFLMANIIVAIIVIAFCMLHVIFPNLMSGLSTRFDNALNSFFALEEVTRTSWLVAVAWFVVVLGFLASAIMVGAALYKGSDKGSSKVPFKRLGVWTAALLFMVLLGPRTINAVSDTIASMRGNGDGQIGSQNGGLSNINIPGINFGGINVNKAEPVNHGPYYDNPKNTLVANSAYKFADDERVWVYGKDKQLHFATSPAVFNKHYGCPVGMRPIDCQAVYLMPSTVDKSSALLGGEPLK